VRPPHSHSQGMGYPSSCTIGSMNASDSVVGCSTCGALYTPAAGDDGVCPTCSSLLPGQHPPRPARPAGPNLRPVSRKPESDIFEVTDDDAPPRRRRGKGRGLRPIAIGVTAALLVAGICTAIIIRPRPLTDAWTSLRRHSPSQAWNSARRLVAHAWLAVRLHLPFDGPQAERSASAAPPTRDASASRGTHRHSQHGKRKRSGDD